KVTTVMGPRRVKNESDFPSRSCTWKSATFEPTLKSCACKTAAPNISDIAKDCFIISFLQFQIYGRDLLGIEYGQRLFAAAVAVILGLEFVFDVGTQSGKVIAAVRFRAIGADL